VTVLVSAISSGTELLVYRGQFPQNTSVDASIKSLGQESLKYPLKYGYSSVGRILSIGNGVKDLIPGDLVFAFQPHVSHYVTEWRSVFKVPPGIEPEDAVFLPNMETAINFLHDGQPLYGDQAVVFGQGIVGLLTTSLLAQFPLSSLVAVDNFELRRKIALSIGATSAVNPRDDGALEKILNDVSRNTSDGAYRGADVCFEVSGSPAALDAAISCVGYNGRIIIGSWYGSKQVVLDLGRAGFHRGHVHLISSQVSQIAPELSGRWTKQRRFSAAWDAIRHVQPASKFVTHRFKFHQAGDAYKLIDELPEDAIQVLFIYD